MNIKRNWLSTKACQLIIDHLSITPSNAIATYADFSLNKFAI
ncbi:hypothetical protein [Aetokthonos hydrillicola]|nr:hypothetical protein [Aetokthonos hydrillicola]